MGIFTFNGLRFLLAGLVLIPIAMLQRKDLVATDRKSYGGVVFAGVLLLGGAALQHAGLRFTTAANAGFITGLYVVLVPIILSIGFKQKSTWATWGAAIVAVVGLFLLTTAGYFRINYGDALELAGALFWALHVILIGWLVRRVNLFHLAAGQYLVCGGLGLSIGLIFERNPLNSASVVWLAVLYTGLISVALGYTLQAFGQRSAPPADAAILLSSEAIFAALFGWVLLSESLTSIQLVGCGLILVSILMVQARAFEVR